MRWHYLTLPLVCLFCYCFLGGGWFGGRFRMRWGPKGPNSPNPSFFDYFLGGCFFCLFYNRETRKACFLQCTRFLSFSSNTPFFECFVFAYSCASASSSSCSSSSSSTSSLFFPFNSSPFLFPLFFLFLPFILLKFHSSFASCCLVFCDYFKLIYFEIPFSNLHLLKVMLLSMVGCFVLVFLSLLLVLPFFV